MPDTSFLYPRLQHGEIIVSLKKNRQRVVKVGVVSYFPHYIIVASVDEPPQIASQGMLQRVFYLRAIKFLRKVTWDTGISS